MGFEVTVDVQVVIRVMFQNTECEAVSLWPAAFGACTADGRGHLRCGVRARGPQYTFPPELRSRLCQLAPGDEGAGKGPGSLSEEPPPRPSERAALHPGEGCGAVGSLRAGLRGSGARLRAGRGFCRPSCGLPGTWHSLALEQP